MKYTIKNLTNKNDVKEMVENEIILTDDEVKAIVKEHNKTAGFFGKKSERGIAKAYRGTLKLIERENKLDEMANKETLSLKEIYREAKADAERKQKIRAMEKEAENQRKAELKALEKQKKEAEKQRKEEEKRLKEAEKRKAEEMKQIKEFCELAGMTIEEYYELSVFERAQLNLQMKQMKDMNSTKNLVALNTVVDGLNKL